MQHIAIKSIKQALASVQTEMALQQMMQLVENNNQETQPSAILLRTAREYQK